MVSTFDPSLATTTSLPTASKDSIAGLQRFTGANVACVAWSPRRTIGDMRGDSLDWVASFATPHSHAVHRS